MRWIAVVGLLAGGVAAASFIGTKDTAPRLTSFQHTQFCKTYGCQFQARVIDNPSLNVVKTDFLLSKLSETWAQVETLDGVVIGLEISLNFRKSLSAADLKAMAAMVDLAAGKRVAFDYPKACQANRPGKPKNAGQINGFLFQVTCFRDPSGADGQWDYVLKAVLPG